MLHIYSVFLFYFFLLFFAFYLSSNYFYSEFMHSLTFSLNQLRFSRLNALQCKPFDFIYQNEKLLHIYFLKYLFIYLLKCNFQVMQLLLFLLEIILINLKYIYLPAYVTLYLVSSTYFHQPSFSEVP